MYESDNWRVFYNWNICSEIEEAKFYGFQSYIKKSASGLFAYFQNENGIVVGI